MGLFAERPNGGVASLLKNEKIKKMIGKRRKNGRDEVEKEVDLVGSF